MYYYTIVTRQMLVSHTHISFFFVKIQIKKNLIMQFFINGYKEVHK